MRTVEQNESGDTWDFGDPKSSMRAKGDWLRLVIQSNNDSDNSNNNNSYNYIEYRMENRRDIMYCISETILR